MRDHATIEQLLVLANIEGMNAEFKHAEVKPFVSLDHKRITLTVRTGSDEAKRRQVIHEIVHRLEPTHNDRFIAILSEHYPTWREARAELNELPLAAIE